MGDFNPPHPVRKVAIPDHLWDAFEEMARQMGSERDGLINQALFMFARLNGFLEVSPRRKTPVPAQPTLNHRVAAAAPGRTAPLRSTGGAEAVAPTIGTPVLGKGDLDDLASLGEVDTGAPDGTPDDPLDIRGNVRPDRLQGDMHAELQVLRLVDITHTSARDQANDSEPACP